VRKQKILYISGKIYQVKFIKKKKMFKKIVIALTLSLLLPGITEVALAKETVTVLGVWGGAEREAFIKALERWQPSRYFSFTQPGPDAGIC